MRMQIDCEKVLSQSLKFIPIKKFISDYHDNGITTEAIHYCIENDKVDFCKFGRERFIVLTEKSINYKPIGK